MTDEDYDLLAVINSLRDVAVEATIIAGARHDVPRPVARWLQAAVTMLREAAQEMEGHNG